MLFLAKLTEDNIKTCLNTGVNLKVKEVHRPRLLGIIIKFEANSENDRNYRFIKQNCISISEYSAKNFGEMLGV